MSKENQVKTKKEALQYKRAVKTMPGYSNTATGKHFPSLKGSNEEFPSDVPTNSQDKATGIARAKFKQFIKKHLFQEIISVVLAIIIGVAGWMASSLISAREKIATFEVRIAVAENNLEHIRGDYTSKEFLSKELEILKLKLENAQKDDLASIETRIALIENQIKYITEKEKSTENN